MLDSLNRYFPSYLSEEDFIKKTYHTLNTFGFYTNNTLPLACICRDEICQSIINHIHNQWGETFNLASLGAMFIAGKTGLMAAISHAPETEERERYVFYAFPHIAINKNGELGKCARFGIAESTACGALICFYNEWHTKNLKPVIDEDDIEISILKKKTYRDITKQ